MIESITGIGRINVGNLRRMENKSQVISKNFAKPLKYVCLTHNDLDACGCVAVLEETLKPIFVMSKESLNVSKQLALFIRRLFNKSSDVKIISYEVTEYNLRS